jgi:hypothetical protein
MKRRHSCTPPIGVGYILKQAKFCNSYITRSIHKAHIILWPCAFSSLCNCTFSRCKKMPSSQNRLKQTWAEWIVKLNLQTNTNAIKIQSSRDIWIVIESALLLLWQQGHEHLTGMLWLRFGQLNLLVTYKRRTWDEASESRGRYND